MSSSVPYAPEPTSGEAIVVSDRKTERMLWWLALAGAAASIVLGLMMVAWPDATLLVGAVFFGIWLVVHGIVHIVRAVMATGDDGAIRALNGILGVLFVVGGIICLRNVLVSILAIATVIGITWLIGGIVGIVAAFSSRLAGGARVLAGVLGAITVLGALAVLLWPGMTLLTLVFLTGIWLIVMGAIQLVIVLRSRPRAAS